MPTTPPALWLDRDEVEMIIERALAEDLPDITTETIFGVSERGTASFIVKENGTVAGLPFASAVFATLDRDSEFMMLIPDGYRVQPGDVIATVEASVRALLSGERIALNLLQRASGIASRTSEFVSAVEGTVARIFDTRKTAPGLRVLDKYAVRAGGGSNHRMGLHDMFLVKNNHIDKAGSISAAVEKIRAAGRSESLMIEVRDLEELDEARGCSPDFILLDNMSLDMMSKAVIRVAGSIPLEASGGVTLESVRAIAQTGVDRISVGGLTHSVTALDISMRISAESAPE